MSVDAWTSLDALMNEPDLVDDITVDQASGQVDETDRE